MTSCEGSIFSWPLIPFRKKVFNNWGSFFVELLKSILFFPLTLRFLLVLAIIL